MVDLAAERTKRTLGDHLIDLCGDVAAERQAAALLRSGDANAARFTPNSADAAARAVDILKNAFENQLTARIMADDYYRGPGVELWVGLAELADDLGWNEAEVRATLLILEEKGVLTSREYGDHSQAKIVVS